MNFNFPNSILNTAKQKFILRSILKTLFSLLLLIGIFILLKAYIPDNYQKYLSCLSEYPFILYTFFFLSEVVLGLIPPELFMIAVLKESLIFFALQLLLFTGLSILGGSVAYGVGYYFKNSRFILYFISLRSTKKYINIYKKMAGLIVILAAVTPLPFAIISLISGLFSLKFTTFLKYSTFRIIRFGVYGGLLWYTNIFFYT